MHRVGAPCVLNNILGHNFTLSHFHWGIHYFHIAHDTLSLLPLPPPPLKQGKTRLSLTYSEDPE